MVKTAKRILITASDDDFFKAYQAGYLYYSMQHTGPLTDDTIFQFVATVLMNEEKSDRWNIGYVSGWYAALYNKSYRAEDPDFKLTVVKGGTS